MAKRIVEGLWDCPYCKSKGIGGLTKHCPCCGHPQDAQTKFYMGEKKEYLASDLAAQYGQGADWVCPFCASLNRVHYQYCANCAAPKDSSEKDYFSAQKTQPEKRDDPPQNQSKHAKPSRKKLWILSGVFLLLIITVLGIFWPRTYDATVSAATWAREINIEAFRTVRESDWSVPGGGRIYEQRLEFHHYTQVLDHYETRTRQVSQQVYDGEDHYTSYTDNGDGTFTENTYSSPRYRTEWHTETYQEPIYRDEPTYATKYYYDIDKWVTDRTESSAGTDSAPYWPEYALAENERTGKQQETYVLSFTTEKETYRASLPLETWEKYRKGDKANVTVINGSITRINGEEIA